MGAAPRAEIPFIAGGPEIAFRVAPVISRGEMFFGAMETGGWVTGPDGHPCFGSLGVLLDDALGYPVVHARPAGGWATSTEISVSFCAPIPPGASTLRAESRVISVGPSGGVAQVSVTDAAGKLIAFGTQRLRWISGTPAALDGAGTPAAPNGAGTYPPPRGGLVTASVHIAYVRPGPVTEPAVFEAVTLHRGRTLAVSQVTSRNVAGKTCTLTTVTCHAIALGCFAGPRLSLKIVRPLWPLGGPKLTKNPGQRHHRPPPQNRSAARSAPGRHRSPADQPAMRLLISRAGFLILVQPEIHDDPLSRPEAGILLTGKVRISSCRSSRLGRTCRLRAHR